MRGGWLEWQGIPVMPTYDPAYLLRNYTRETRQAMGDLCKANLDAWAAKKPVLTLIPELV